MAYVTNDDIQDRLGAATYLQLTDDDGDGQPDQAVVDEARLGAEGAVNSYLAQRYQTPIDTTEFPELAGLLATVTLDLVEHQLRARRPPVPSDVADRRADTLAWLAKVATGAVALPAAVPQVSGGSSGPAALITGADRRLSHDELESF